MPQFSSHSDIYDQGRAWQWRAVRASIGTTTGLIVMAMLAKRPRNGPAFGDNCTITLDGRMVTPVRRNGIWGKPETLGTVADVRDNIRRLADHCKLNDADRLALFAELNKWVLKDFRATSEA